jgi:hypothetical protein
MSWMEDRDLLVAETRALVMELGRARPSLANRSDVEAIYRFEPPQGSSPVEPLHFERIAPLLSVNQRDEIANRLAAFRATQVRFQREREAFSIAMLNKARVGKSS